MIQQILAILIPAALLVFAVVAFVRQLITYRQLQSEAAPDPETATPAQEILHGEKPYRVRRLRRRMQTSVLLALIAIGLWVGQSLDAQQQPRAYIACWMIVVLLTAWIGVLAAGDLIVVQRQRGRLERKLDAERREMESELRRLRLQQQQAQGDRASTNGHNGEPPPA